MKPKWLVAEAERAEIPRTHERCRVAACVLGDSPHCHACAEGWPCLVARLLRGLEQAEDDANDAALLADAARAEARRARARHEGIEDELARYRVRAAYLEGLVARRADAGIDAELESVRALAEARGACISAFVAWARDDLATRGASGWEAALDRLAGGHDRAGGARS